MLACGRFLFAAGFDEIIRIYDIKLKREAYIFFNIFYSIRGQLENHDSSINSLKSFENYLFSGGEDGKINIWKMKDWNLLHSLDTQICLKDLAIHNSGKIMVVCGK